jgi:hypothetical protein
MLLLREIHIASKGMEGGGRTTVPRWGVRGEGDNRWRGYLARRSRLGEQRRTPRAGEVPRGVAPRGPNTNPGLSQERF